jgi:hypothetical protein
MGECRLSTVYSRLIGSVVVAIGVASAAAAEHWVVPIVESQRRGTATAGPGTTGQVAIEAGLVMQAGNVVRLARTEFHLARESVTDILLRNDPKGLSHSSAPSVVSHADMELNTYCAVQNSAPFRTGVDLIVSISEGFPQARA